ncbi:MAG TPA: GNAT family N-acetyltransferase [Chitinophagaceae bacterium]|nr:GNAT family N-acetyltransferase [Chitinophagaceae bacterium]
MQRAQPTDREIIIAMLVNSFRNNKSVQYIIKQDAKKERRLRRLMEYSYEVCSLFGDVFITEDKAGCALIIKPDKKKPSLTSLLLDVQLITGCVGFSNLQKAMRREAIIKAQHPVGPLYYLWFIGVEPAKQQRGIGSQLLKGVIDEAQKEGRTLCLETSTQTNIAWYQSFGCTIYNELDFGYTLYCLKKE